jgi:hypothetical protein
VRETEEFAGEDGDGDCDAGAKPFRQGDGADVEGEGQGFEAQVTSPR